MVTEFRWQPRRWASRVVRALVFVVPLALGVAAATLVARALPTYTTVWGGVAWWVAVLAASFATVTLADRIARRFLPLAALLNMSLVFPAAAPSRVKVALRTWTTAQLQAQIHEARDQGIDDDPTRAGETVLVLVAALNAHDRVTRGHAERTRAFVDVLAEELDVSLDDREKLRWVALLHDVGKLKVDEAILNKEGDLDNDEWAAIKLHPQLGDELIAPIKEFLAPWADTILHHHERWDGTGYPLGISGEEINRGARIVAVADAFDAMTARRSYQPAMSPRFALRELSENAGSQFDPTVVRAFLNISASRLRRLTGPLTFLAQIPFLAGFQRVAEWAGSFAATSAAVVTAVATGIVGPISAITPPETVALPTPTTVPVVTTLAPESTTLPPPTSSTTTPAPGSTTSTTTTASPPTTTTSGPTTTTTASPSTTTTSGPTTTTTVPATTTSTTTTTVPASTTSTTTTTTTTTTQPPGNLPPTANDDAVSGNPNDVIWVRVLRNDTDPEGDPLTVISCSTSTFGVVATVGPLGKRCRYENLDPDNWDADDTFTYAVSDGQGGTATGTVTVTPRG